MVSCITFHPIIRDIISSLIITIYGIVPESIFMYPVNYQNNWTRYFFLNYILTTPVDRNLSYTIGVSMLACSFRWSIYPGHVMRLTPGW